MQSEVIVPATSTRPEIGLPPTGLFIAGEWRKASDAAVFSVVAPATEEQFAEVSSAAAADVDAAVEAARRQFDGGEWSQLPGERRGGLLHHLADLVARDASYLDQLEMLDVGQPSTASGAVVATLRYFAGWADKIDGRHVALPHQAGRPRHAYTVREPIGVLAAITPWNAPMMIASWKLAPALAAGCTVVLKPPEDAPLSTLHLARLIAEAGFPPGTVNVIPGLGHVAGAALVRHAGVDKVSFTGSQEVGCEIATAVAPSLTPVTLELGGKSPQIVFADADLDTVIPAAARSFYARAGQICSAGTRVLVQRSVEDEVVAGLASEVRRVPVGDPFDPGTVMGPLISEAQLTKVMRYVDAGIDEGAELISGGERLDRIGYFVQPTVFRGANDLAISQNEIFGPVATTIAFDDVDEAVQLANGTRYGLAATIWTRDISKAHLTAQRLRVGSIRVNGGEGVDARLPWGGMKMSGLGRELSYRGIEACTQEKAVTVVL